MTKPHSSGVFFSCQGNLNMGDSLSKSHPIKGKKQTCIELCGI